jgi:glucose/mannose-6-phosphate isomerase
MSALEPPYGDRDSGGMAARIAGIPDQIDDALTRVARSPWPAPRVAPDLLAVGGMGGSAIAAELTAQLWADRLPGPMLVVRDERWPACVTARSLVVLSSYSGETAETLALEEEARARGVARVAITTGGTLAARCAAAGVPVMRIPGGSPPRAALFSGWVTLTGLLGSLGWIEDPAPAWREAAALLRARDARLGAREPEADNPAKCLARAISGKRVFVYGAAQRTGAVATRWRQQLNENAKLLGHSAVVPELNHNEIVGWEHPETPARDAALVTLHDREDGAGATRRLALTAEYAAAQGAGVHALSSEGESRVARIASLVQFGDYVSLYLALLRGVDPTPIASIDAFKRRLAAAGSADGA